MTTTERENIEEAAQREESRARQFALNAEASRRRALSSMHNIDSYPTSQVLGGGVVALASVALYAVDVWRAKP